MKIIAFAIALLMIFLGLTGLFRPEAILGVAHYSFTPAGLYVVALVRVAIGLVFFLAAPASRAPRTLRVIGVIACVAGVTAAVAGIEKGQAMMDLWSAHGPGFVRIAAIAVFGIGSFIAYATFPRRPEPAPR